MSNENDEYRYIFCIGEDERDPLTSVQAGDTLFDRATGELVVVEDSQGKGDAAGQLQFVVVSDGATYLVGVEGKMFSDKFGLAATKSGEPNLSVEINDKEEELFFEAIDAPKEDAVNEIARIFEKYRYSKAKTEDEEDE